MSFGEPYRSPDKRITSIWHPCVITYFPRQLLIVTHSMTSLYYNLFSMPAANGNTFNMTSLCYNLFSMSTANGNTFNDIPVL